MKHRLTKSKGLLIGLVIILSVVFLYAAYQVISYWRSENKNRQLAEDLIEKAVIVPAETPELSHNKAPDTPPPETAPIEVNFEALWQENRDIIAWIYCKDTPIHYPIVQSADNSYYLRPLPNGEYNMNGTIFLDYRCEPDFSGFNSIIHGHHMKSGEMFGMLPKYKEQAYYDEHPVLYLLTPDQDYKVELIAGYITPSDSDTYALPTTAEEKKTFLEHAVQESTFHADVSFSETDTFVTLSTCSYEYETSRYVVVGKLTKIE